MRRRISPGAADRLGDALAVGLHEGFPGSQFVTANVVGAYSLLEFCRRMGIWLNQVGDRALPMGASEHPHGDVDRMPLRKAHSVCLQVL